MNLKLEATDDEDILDCAREALRIADHLGIPVEWYHGEIWCCMRPGGSVKMLVDAYHVALTDETTWIAHGHPIDETEAKGEK